MKHFYRDKCMRFSMYHFQCIIVINMLPCIDFSACLCVCRGGGGGIVVDKVPAADEFQTKIPLSRQLSVNAAWVNSESLSTAEAKPICPTKLMVYCIERQYMC